MLPHERSLAQRHAREPFVVLGVSTEASREALCHAQQRLQVPWRSCWDGPGMRVSRDWGVDVLPTVYLIDHRGVVRFRAEGAPRPQELDRQVEQMLREARASS